MWILLSSAAVYGQEGKVVTGAERKSAVQVQLGGAADLHYAWREGILDEAADALNGLAAGDQASEGFWAGRLTLRMDVFLKGNVSAVLEIENRDFDEGQNIPFSDAAERADPLAIEQAHIDVSDFLLEGMSLRVGVQDVTYRNRAHDEPFFMDLGESEGFFAGGSPVRNTVDRDVREATGVRVNHAFSEGILAQGAAVVYGEGGASSSDEAVYALAANVRPSDNLATWALAAMVTGPEGARVTTLGAGFDGFLGAGKGLELFGEAYLQGGRTAPGISKRAFALNGGARGTDLLLDGLWAEAAFSMRSGDRGSTARRDEAFQSYENESRFLILQSAEFGLDVDTNVRLVRAAAGFGPIPIPDHPLRLRLDAGRFTADEKLGGLQDWGLEADAGADWNYSDSLTFWVKGAWLARSEVLEGLTGDRDSGARLAAAGADLRF